jgi:PhzF family phenazine biosynthesis protein
MQIPIYQIDAFTSERFHGNSAAVCPLDHWLPVQTMQSIAAENNLAETAFYVKEGDRYGLRWFTPTVEIDLCGHATVATAHVIFQHYAPSLEKIAFDSRSGELTVTRDAEGRLWLNFPARPAKRASAPSYLSEGLGAHPLEVLSANYLLAVFPKEEDVRTLQPNFPMLASGDPVCCTAPGDAPDVDFVSRFFAPSHGIDEDPVTGSSHCILTPYWSRRLNKKTLHARQISARGGELWLEDLGDRVRIGGFATPYLQGTIEVAG